MVGACGMHVKHIKSGVRNSPKHNTSQNSEGNGRKDSVKNSELLSDALQGHVLNFPHHFSLMNHHCWFVLQRVSEQQQPEETTVAKD